MTHRYTCRVRWSDVDGYGHVNNVKFLEYYQEARVAFLAEALPTRPLDMVVARISTHYRRPVLFRLEPYVVETAVTHVGRTSFTLHNRIVDPVADDAEMASADIVLVTVDVRTGSATPHADEVRRVLVGHAHADVTG